MRLPLPFSTYQLTAEQTASKRLVNCYAEQQDPQDAKSPILLRRTPGIKEWITVGTRGRGMLTFNDRLYAVSGDSLYEIEATGSSRVLGAISGLQQVQAATNAGSLVIVSEPNSYAYDGTTFQQIADVDFTSRGASSVRFLDNYLIFLEPGSGRIFASDLGSAVNYDALSFATAEGAPDNAVAIEVDHRELVVFGTQSIELWYNAGATPFPLARIPSGGFIEIGCAASRSVVKADNSFFWLASDYTVRRLSDSVPVRVSTHAVEEQIASFSRKSDASGFTYTMAGHVFYVLSFPSAQRTFVFDITSGSWHERESYNYGRWRPNSYVFCFGKHLVQDSFTGKIGELDPATYAEWSGPLVMRWTYPKVYAAGSLARFDRFEIQAEVGIGLISGQGSDPQVTLEVADNGREFRFMANRNLGAMGEYSHRIYWHRLGSARNRIFRCSVSDPVPVTVSDTQIEVDAGRV